MIGSLMYLIASRPDIMFAVCACTRHQVTPKELHLHVVKRIFRYLKGNPKLGLWYPNEYPFDLVAYSDSDYGGANQDRKSTTGGCQFLGRRLVSWQCNKQTIVATSITETEYVAAASGCGQVLWIQNQLLDYGTWKTLLKPLPYPMKHYHKLLLLVVVRELKVKVKTLKDNERKREGFAQEDAPNTGGMDQGEDLLDRDKSADKGSDSIDEMSHVLGTLRAVNILASRGLRSIFTTASLSVPNASTCVSFTVATASGSFPIAAIFTTASVVTSTTRVTRSSRGVPSKEKVLEQMSVQLARDLEAKFAQEDQIIKEQAERDFKIAKIHAERELELMIAELDRSNEMVVKYLSEYEQTEAGLSHDEKVELINELLIYQRHLAQIKKYQAQQNKPATKTERINFYMLILRSNAGWKAKDFKGMTFEKIEEKIILV
uniref:Uncharacterized mitochondrial protein AtMg00810-like n=1 Tax=Tanacetum cinerariifolium TaxID=118510 RepID=A0A699IAL2_TANCI|nr:uncharacterized mitochondrial protein AtMg00810-like [Tanacetum cinerariifolium]